jgi:hypothetical protein
MGHSEKNQHDVTEATSGALPDLNPWREVGWIFRDGECVAIERHGQALRSRVLGD